MIRKINTIGLAIVFALLSVSAFAQNSATVVNKSESGNLVLTANGAQYVGNYVSVVTSSGNVNFSFRAEIFSGTSPEKAVKIEFSQFLFGIPTDFRCTLTPSGIANCSGKEQ